MSLVESLIQMSPLRIGAHGRLTGKLKSRGQWIGGNVAEIAMENRFAVPTTASGPSPTERRWESIAAIPFPWAGEPARVRLHPSQQVPLPMNRCRALALRYRKPAARVHWGSGYNPTTESPLSETDGEFTLTGRPARWARVVGCRSQRCVVPPTSGSCGRRRRSMPDVTRILDEARGGDPRALDRLLAAVYEDLRQLANAKLARERRGHSLQATDLVHEAYLRLVGPADPAGESLPWEGSAHFFSAAAEAMRRILVESARRRRTLKRGGGRDRKDLDEQDAMVTAGSIDLLALDEALEKLSQEDPLKANLVKLRYFAGLTGEHAAEVLGISRATADRHWAFARAWLHAEICKGDEQKPREQRPWEDRP